MAFTYTAALTSNKDKVRFLIQDTTNTTARPNLLDDGEIDWVLTVEHNVYMAAAQCADVLASRFRGLVSKTVGSLSLRYDEGARTWSAIADRLRRRGALHQLPSMVLTTSDRDGIWDDTTLLKPELFTELHYDHGSQAPKSPRSEEELP